MLSQQDHEGEVRRRRIWRLRDLVRIEEPPGTLRLIAGASTYWRSWPADDGVVELPREAAERWIHDDNILVIIDPHDYWSSWLRSDERLVRGSLRPSMHEGRSAWSFTAPLAKGATPDLTVDAELGLVVRATRPDVGTFQEWTELRIDPTLDEPFFTHAEG